ncbi:hypothetical protein F4778DRAFT_762483 [Xylariomycetidae sp. FL2044]|nr:hypothetical protein F4778DRAFT_762483 [Xylariomycetidae sp. FL2044]
MTSAAAKVLAITELLELILSELPPLALIRSQAVCRTWQQLIANSPMLEYAMWMTFETDYPHPASDDDLIPPLKLTPEQEDRSSAAFVDDDARQAYDRKRYISNISRHLNPIIVQIVLKHLPEHTHVEFDWKHSVGLKMMANRFHLHADVLYGLIDWSLEHQGSINHWRHMSLMSPFTGAIDWTMNNTIRRQGQGRRIQYSFTHHVLTLDDLMFALYWACERWEHQESVIHWQGHTEGYCDLDRGYPKDCCEEELVEEFTEHHEEEDPYLFDTYAYKGIQGVDRHGHKRVGKRMTRKEHLHQCIRIASTKDVVDKAYYYDDEEDDIQGIDLADPAERLSWNLVPPLVPNVQLHSISSRPRGPGDM